jgi:xanthine dehydrogenase accessory factor
MRDILNDLHRWQAEGEEIALATLIDTHGASPRPAGARLCCTRTGQMVGSVSGGCVETDVFERAMQVLADGRPLIQRYGIDDETSVAVGLSCGGEIDVLIEPWRDDDVWQALTRVVDRRDRAALCVALSPDAMLGRHLLVVEGNGRLGGIDDALDGELETTAGSVLAHGEARIVTLERGGQEHRVYIEPFAPEPRLFIVGATHTAIPLCGMAAELGFHVTVIDPRTPFATRERFPRAAELVLEWPDQVLAEASLDRESYVVTLTHDLKFDIPTLRTALGSDAGYIGALGSRGTHERRIERLREEGVDAAELERVHTPIGLDIGARSPEEIALAILAEIIAVRNARDGRSLVHRTMPIHAAPK